jgi:hypothetical protein
VKCKSLLDRKSRFRRVKSERFNIEPRHINSNNCLSLNSCSKDQVDHRTHKKIISGFDITDIREKILRFTARDFYQMVFDEPLGPPDVVTSICHKSLSSHEIYYLTVLFSCLLSIAERPTYGAHLLQISITHNTT